jgi:hypothetical protein
LKCDRQRFVEGVPERFVESSEYRLANAIVVRLDGIGLP